ncbi:hypothetical protein C1H46_008370 [Malus baccata]|uniref:Nicotianamine synthase n=1 Tax=Malus baccata TaxID=106549 RepID=A0A540N6D5_MALBA|nr:hypothetical protein C1H46_008370 [Malus baccata]
MASLQISNWETQIPAELLIARLVNLCTLPCDIDIMDLSQEVQTIRQSLIDLCSHTEGLLELEFSTFLVKVSQPLNTNLEHKILVDNGVVHPNKGAFVGSGPMPLTSFILATYHMKSTHFDNFDIDEKANDVAQKIVFTDVELSKRMKFETNDIMKVREKLAEYECIFLAALVGMNKENKVKILQHIRKYMKDGSVLLVRSAKGARAFLYPVVEEHDLPGFELLTIFHPNNEVINSVVLVRKPIF